MISVIICTYNRAEILSETLNSWLTVKQDKIDAELIVVDNNSTDATRSVVKTFSDSCTCPLRYIHEEKPGLSNARNKGIEVSKGEIIAFVDDDVDFHENWADEIVKVFNENPKISCVGGKSIPKFEILPPQWITEDMYSFYGSTDSGDEDRKMVFPEHPYGLNMVFRISVFQEVGLFNPELGRIKNCLISNEEFDYFKRVKEQNLIVYYASGAILYHRIQMERTQKKWLLDRSYWQGISDVISNELYEERSKIYFLKKMVGAIKHILFPNGVVSFVNSYKYYADFSFQKKLVLYKLLGYLRQYTFKAIKISI